MKAYKFARAILWIALVPCATHAQSTGKLTAFGDSITQGTGASAADHSYPALLAARKAWSLANMGSGGSQVVDNGYLIHHTDPQPGETYTYMIGTNDSANDLADPGKLEVFRDAHLDEAAWLALPASAKVLRGQITWQGSWKDTEPWTGDGFGDGRASGTQWDSAVLRLTGPTIYIGTLAVDGNTGEFAMAVDGQYEGTFQCYAPVPVQTPWYKTRYAPHLIRITGLSSGAHTVSITVTSPTGRVFLEWAASPALATARTSPAVYLTTVPRQQYDAHGDAVALHTGVIVDNFAQLVGDGLNVYLVDVVPYIDDADFFDNLHPNDVGEEHYTQAFYDAMTPRQWRSPKRRLD